MEKKLKNELCFYCIKSIKKYLKLKKWSTAKDKIVYYKQQNAHFCRENVIKELKLKGEKNE